MLAATEGTVNATGCPWPICGHENTRTPLGHMQSFQTYLCRVRKGSGSSLFDFDQVCCINFGDVGRLNLEEAVLIVLFRFVGAFFLALVVCLYLRILRCKYPRVCFCTLVFCPFRVSARLNHGIFSGHASWKPLVLNFPSENSAFLWQYGHEVSVDLCDPGLGSC